MNDFLLRMKSLLGDEFDEFLKFYNSDDFIKGLRVNTLKCLPEKLCSLLDFELKKTPFCDEGFYIPSDVKSIGNNPLHHAGAFYVQEPSATSAVTMLDVHEGDYVLDLCAAPGGKSTQIGAKLNGTGLLWSNEIVRSRANILLSNIERMGISNAVVSNCRPDELCKRLENRFDRILVDAPCSGVRLCVDNICQINSGCFFHAFKDFCHDHRHISGNLIHTIAARSGSAFSLINFCDSVFVQSIDNGINHPHTVYPDQRFWYF